MRIPLNWLKEYLPDLKGRGADIKVSPEVLAEKLTMSGTEVEVIKSDAEIDSKIVVGEVLEVTKHPNADRLNVVKVKISANRKPQTANYLQVVCGGTNLEVRQKIALATIGAKIGDFEIKEAELRGVKSYGMICSESELGLAEHATGEIMVLGADAKIGARVKDIIGKGGVVLDAEITPNRGDCLSMVGIARELSAVYKKPIKFPEIKFKETKQKASDLVHAEVQDGALCPRYILRVLKIKKNGDSPVWMQKRLEAAGMRSISALVDIGNYVMLEYGQPLHVFDMRKLKIKNEPSSTDSGRKLKIREIIVRRAKSGEEIRTLDGVERKLTNNDLIVADSTEPIAIAGVIGGKNTEVDEKTTSILLESATFDKTSVRKTAQRLALRSEASNRFEKGIPMPLNQIAIDRAAGLIQEICGGEILEGRVDMVSKWSWVQHIGIRKSKINNFLGVEVPVKESVNILRNLGFEVEVFDVAAEARSHVGKPYAFGAKFKTHGTDAFDCSYLTDYVYSKIGKFIGYTSLGQIEMGKPVKDKDLKPGDILFMKGVIDKSVTDHYYVPDGKGGYEKIATKNYPKGVGHNALYIGNGKIVHARHFEYDFEKKKWVKASDGERVVEESADVFLKHPEYLGARRYIDDLDDYIAVTVPWWRLDVSIEEDLIEEIARIYGYDRIPRTLPHGLMSGIEENKNLKNIEKVRDILAALGFSENYSYSFVSEKDLTRLGVDSREALRIENPLSNDQEYMRPTLIASVLNNVSKNQRNLEELRTFEIANIYVKNGNNLPHETLRLSGAYYEGETLGIHYKNNKDFYALKGALGVLLGKMGLFAHKTELKKAENKLYKDGTSVDIKIGGKKIGSFGEVSTEIRNSFGIKKKCFIFDIDLPAVAKFANEQKYYAKESRFPSIKRDLSFIVDAALPVQKILEVVGAARLRYLKNIKITDIYFGAELGENKKSVTISLEFVSDERTLQDGDADTESTKIVQAVKQKLKGDLRDER